MRTYLPTREPLNGARPKWPRHGLLLPSILEPLGQLSDATAQLVGSGDGRRKQGAANPTYPGLAQLRYNVGIETPDRFNFGIQVSGLLSPEGPRSAHRPPGKIATDGQLWRRSIHLIARWRRIPVDSVPN